MDFLNGITIILLYQLLGEVSAMLLRIPVPGPVLGMLFLFLTLLSRRHIPESVDLSSKVLLNHLSLLFVPAGVGVIVHFDRILQEWIPISITLVLSTVATMATTAVIMLGTQHLLARRWLKDA